MTDYIIVGAGPAGLACALLLQQLGNNVIVYEGRDSIPNDPQQSYPIGINPRTLHTLSLIEKSLEEKAISTGIIVDAWHIYGGPMKVADLKSGSVYGTTRGGMNVLLYEKAVERGVKVVFNHKLTGVDIDNRTLNFTNPATKETVEVSGKSSRVIAGDGVNSLLRTAMIGRNGFQSTLHPWGKEFRVLFAQTGREVPGVDMGIHYIFSGMYSAAIKNGDMPRWSVVIGVDDNMPEAAELLSSEPTQSAIDSLKKHVAQKAPKMMPVFSDQDFADYFSRRSFKGQVVENNRLNHEEWILLVGDAGHGVLPATGEGINSAMEDASELYDLVKRAGNKTTDLFTQYNAIRFPNTSGLTKLAIYLNGGIGNLNIFEKVTRGVARVLESMLFKKSYNDYCFGPDAALRRPYGDIVGEWSARQGWLLPATRLLVYPLTLAGIIISIPFRIVYHTVRLPYVAYKYLSGHSSSAPVKPIDKPTSEYKKVI